MILTILYRFSRVKKTYSGKNSGDCCYFCAVEEWRARKRGLPAHVQLAEKMRRRRGQTS